MGEIAARLQRGSWAPGFEVFDLYGNTVRFESLNSSPIWLAFYRYASCPMCNVHFDDVVGRTNLLAKYGIRFVAIFESAVENFPAKMRDNPLPLITIIPDQGLKVYNLYGVEASLSALFKPDVVVASVKAAMAGYGIPKPDARLDRIPAHFLILPGGYVHFARYGRSVADHLKWRELDDFYDAIEGSTRQFARAGNAPAEVPRQSSNEIEFEPPELGTEIEIDLEEETEERAVEAASEDDKTIVLPRPESKNKA